MSTVCCCRLDKVFSHRCTMLWCCASIHGSFRSCHHLSVTSLPQEVLCEDCRLASHKQHRHDLVANAATAERARMKDIAQKTRALSSALQSRIDALNASSKKCTNSASGVKQDITRRFHRLRSAVVEREEHLTSAVDQLLQVSCGFWRTHSLFEHGSCARCDDACCKVRVQPIFPLRGLVALSVLQVRVDSIESERTRSTATYSSITAIQERCDLALSANGMNDIQLLAHARKGVLKGNGL